jgi:hypothetical protein
MSYFWDALIATVARKGVYEDEPFEKIGMPELPTGDDSTQSVLSLYNEFEERVKRVVGEEVVLKGVVIPGLFMPWDNPPIGETKKISDVLNLIGMEGYPGYGMDVNGIGILRGVGSFGREVYALVPDCGEHDTGYIEVSPVPKEPAEVV